MSPKINFSSLVNLFKTPYAVQGQSSVEHGFQNGESKSGTNSITRTIRKNYLLQVSISVGKVYPYYSKVPPQNLDRFCINFGNRSRAIW